MPEIKVLSSFVADKIAAGEVVERPAAAVKELVENSIDAGADRIRVEIKNGGIKYISVQDNGKGIPKDELECAFLRHATSKLREVEDLYSIGTMGFRGEALASICAVSEVTVISRQADSEEGVCMTLKHSQPSEKTDVACNVGTTMVVENLFANVPARMKFLKKDATEAGYVTDMLGRIALSRPDISFTYISDGKEIFKTSGDGKIENVVLNIYDLNHAKGVYKVDHEEHGVRVFGVVGKAELARGNRTRQTLIVNGRYIKNHVVSKVVEEAFRNVLMTGKFPFFVLNIELNPELVDVNVHPAKTEIKFANEKEIYNIVHAAVKNAIYNVPAPKPEEKQDAPAREISFDRRPETVDARPNPAVVRQFMENTIPTPYKASSFKAPTGRQEDIFEYILEHTAKEEIPQPSATEPVMGEKPALAVEAAPKEEKSVFTEVPHRVVGQIFDTYVVVQKGDEMFLIDQHAAHERKRFEMLKADWQNKKCGGQMLLSPIVMDVDGVEMQAIRDNAVFLQDIGFGMEEFGRGSVIIRETPLVGDEDDIKSLAQEVIGALCDGRPMGLMSFEERILDMISCTYAIKANKALNMAEMEAIVGTVEELEEKGITSCPHGRPIKIAFTKREIEKMFKRIV